MFTFLGFYLFHREGDKENANYFRSLDESFTSLFILITTTNYPDVMLPYYRNHRVDFIFFLFYISIGLYLILFMVFASVYNTYQNITVAEIRTYLKNREALLLQAFDYLDSDGDGAIDLQTWKSLISFVRPDLNEEQQTILFMMVDEDQLGRIEETEFMEICDYLDLIFEKGPAYFSTNDHYSFVNLVTVRDQQNYEKQNYTHTQEEFAINGDIHSDEEAIPQANPSLGYSINHDGPPPPLPPPKKSKRKSKRPASSSAAAPSSSSSSSSSSFFSKSNESIQSDVSVSDDRSWQFNYVPPSPNRSGLQLICYKIVTTSFFHMIVGISVGSLIVLTIMETYTPCSNTNAHVISFLSSFICFLSLSLSLFVDVFPENESCQ